MSTEKNHIENKDLEKRLAKFTPLEQRTLASKILDAWQIVKHENVTVAATSASPYCCYIKSFSLGSALFGAIVGAAATVLAMIYLMPPKVEIREVVRELPARRDSNIVAEQVAPSPVAANQSIEHARPRRNVDDQFVLAEPSLRDIDALLVQRESFARQMSRYESETDSAVSFTERPRVSPEAYRELMRDLSARP